MNRAQHSQIRNIIEEKFKVDSFAELLNNYSIIFDRAQIEIVDNMLKTYLSKQLKGNFFDYLENIVGHAIGDFFDRAEEQIEEREEKIKELEHKVSLMDNILFD